MAAFAYTHTEEFVGGGMRFAHGTFTSSGGATGGDIYTGLERVVGMKLMQKSDAVVASDPKVNESMPCNDPVTIVTAANAAGRWFAWGV